MLNGGLQVGGAGRRISRQMDGVGWPRVRPVRRGYDVHQTNQGPQNNSTTLAAAHFRPLGPDKEGQILSRLPVRKPQIGFPDLSVVLLTEHLELAWRCEGGLILQTPSMQHPMGQTVVVPRVPTRSIGSPNGLAPDRTLARSRNSVARLSAITSFVWNDG